MKYRNFFIYIFFFSAVLPFWQNYTLPIGILFSVYLFAFNSQQVKNKLNKWPFKIFIFFVSIFFIYLQLGTLKGLRPGINILTLIAILKNLEIKNRKDVSIFFLLTLLVFTANIITSETIALGFYLFLIVSSFFILITEGLFTGKKDEFFKERIRVLIRVVGFSIPVSILLFVFFPRLGVGSFFDVVGENTFKLGFTEKLRPGDISKIIGSKEVYFRAKFKDGKEPLFSDLYWKGSILNVNNGFDWDKGKQSYNREKIFSKIQTWNYELSFSNLKKTPVFVLDGVKKIKARSKGKISKRRGNTFEYTPFSNQKILIEVKNESFSYKKILPAERKEYLQRPSEISARILALSEQLKGFDSNKTIENIKDYFLKNKFQYTLAPGNYSKSDGLEEFLFDRKLGFCEHYASSFAILLRLAGVPSRVITGFMGGTYNPFGNYYFITGEDAHAWVEAWIEGKGWVRIDPTFYVAPLRIERGASEYFYALLRGNINESLGLAKLNKLSWIFKSYLIFDLVYYKMNHFFFNFDFEFQNDTLKKIWKTNRPRTILFLLTVGLGTCFLFLIKLIFYRQKHKSDELQKIFHNFCKKLGAFPEINEGPLSFKLRINRNSNIQQSTLEILDLFMDLKYNPSFDQNLFKDFKNRVKRFKSI